VRADESFILNALKTKAYSEDVAPAAAVSYLHGAFYSQAKVGAVQFPIQAEYGADGEGRQHLYPEAVVAGIDQPRREARAFADR
jgi:hypothetical protein